MIPVTKPYLPAKSNFLKYIDEIFEREWLTNNGPMVQLFERELMDNLNLEGLLFVTNGTIALQLAIKALNLTGEIITTPFSYVATTSSIVWEGCKPVFVDIDQNTLNINPDKIEEAITSNTSAILATHCFGNACDIDKIEVIAKKHDLKVIYDAAHCFGTKYKGKSIFEYGDISTCSLHATKLMHSVEGGFIVCKDLSVMERLKLMRNFGHDGFDKFNGIGINGKNSELHAAMGICVLEDIIDIFSKRKKQFQFYSNLLQQLSISYQKIDFNCEYNYAYFPVLFDNEEVTLKIKSALEQYDIFPRRYFFPSLSSLDYVEERSSTIAKDCAERILCLPLYHNLKIKEQTQVVEIIKNVLYE